MPLSFFKGLQSAKGQEKVKGSKYSRINYIWLVHYLITAREALLSGKWPVESDTKILQNISKILYQTYMVWFSCFSRAKAFKTRRNDSQSSRNTQKSCLFKSIDYFHIQYKALATKPSLSCDSYKAGDSQISRNPVQIKATPMYLLQKFGRVALF